MSASIFVFSPRQAEELLSASQEAVQAYARCRARLEKLGPADDPLRALDAAMIQLAKTLGARL